MLSSLSSYNVDITSSLKDDIDDIVELFNQVSPAGGVVLIPDVSFKSHLVKSLAVVEVTEKLITINTQFEFFKNTSSIKKISYKSKSTLIKVNFGTIYSAIIESWKDNFFNRAINFMDGSLLIVPQISNKTILDFEFQLENCLKLIIR